MLNVSRMSTIPAAAAFSWKRRSGRDTQLNIWIGNAV
jgi:hypothetical protein